MADNSRIEIHQPNMNIVITDKPYPAPENSEKAIGAQGGACASTRIRLLMRTEATMRLFESISWGARYKHLDVEKAGLLVGQYHRDTSRIESVIWGDVIAVIPFDPALVRATKTDITITQDAWRKMLDEFVPHRDAGNLMLGWYHTHLDNMPPRISGQDIATQSQYFDGVYSFAVVLNPTQENWTVYCGPEAAECKGELFVTEEMLTQFGDPKITIQNARGDLELRDDGTVTHLGPDDTPIIPERLTLTLSTEPLIPGWVIQKFEDVGELIKRSRNQLKVLQHQVISPNTRGNNSSSTLKVRSQHSSDVPRSENAHQPSPRIIVQETAKPKITILQRDNRNEEQRRVQSTVFVVSADDPSHPQRQNQEEIQLIDQNIIDVVESITRINANNSLGVSSPINAHITLNNDLTLEVTPCEDKSNAMVMISTQPFEIAFPQDRIGHQVAMVAEIVKRQRGEPSYLLYISKTPESIKVYAFQVKKEAIA